MNAYKVLMLIKPQILVLLTCLLWVQSPSAWSAPVEDSSPSATSNLNQESLKFNEQGVQALKAGHFAEAEEDFRKALSIDTGNLTAAFNLAGMLLNNKKEASAIALLKEYTVKAPNDVGLRVRLGDAFFATKKIKEAKTEYLKAYVANEKYPGVAQKLGTIYSLENNLVEAEKMFFKAVEENPQDVKLRVSLANIFMANGKIDKGIATAKSGLQIKSSAELYLTLGKGYELNHDVESALIAYKRALEMGDASRELKERIAALQANK